MLIPWPVEDELSRFFAGEHEGRMGYRSIQGGIQDSLERCGAQMPGRAGDISDGALRASAWSRIVQKRLDACTPAHRDILAHAFGPITFAGYDINTEGLSAYGQRPNAVLACPELRELHQGSTWPPPVWLVRKADTARGIPHGDEGEVSDHDRMEAERVVAFLREAAERQLKEALEAYGAVVTDVDPPGLVSLRQIAKAVGVHHETVGIELKRRGIGWTVKSQAPNAKRFVRISDLWLHWKEAAESLCGSASEQARRAA
jgi:hypothetical protein